MLDKNKSLTYNQLVRVLQENQVIRNRTAISEHLKYLTLQKIIDWKKNSIGKPSSITFTKEAWVQRKYGILKVDYDNKRGICKKWREQHKADIEKDGKTRLLIFLLLSVSMGHRSLMSTSEIRAGQMVILDTKDNPRYYSLDFETGFSPDDLCKKYDDDRLRYPDPLLLNRFTPEEAKQMIEELEKKDDITFRKSVQNDGQIRYYLEDEGLKDLLIDCFAILQAAIEIMQQYWYIFSKTPLKEEFEWYRKVVGEQISAGFFLEIESNRTDKKTIKDLCLEYNSQHYSPLADIILKNSDDYQKKLSKVIRKQLLTELCRKTISLQHALQHISTSEDIKKTISEKKYEWIIEVLRHIVRPNFLKDYYKLGF